VRGSLTPPSGRDALASLTGKRSDFCPVRDAKIRRRTRPPPLAGRVPRPWRDASPAPGGTGLPPPLRGEGRVPRPWRDGFAPPPYGGRDAFGIGSDFA